MQYLKNNFFQIRLTSVSLLILIFSLYECASLNKDGSYNQVKQVDSFSGENIRDNDIMIYSHKEKGLISISGNREKFIFLLPYSEDWIVKRTDNSIIQLSSNDKNLLASISTERGNPKIDPEKFLRELKIRIESRIGIKMQDVRILASSTNKILGYFLEMEKQNVKIKSDNFWSIRQRSDDVILKLHISMLNVPEEDIRKAEQVLPIFMDSGFRVLTDADLEKLQTK